MKKTDSGNARIVRIAGLLLLSFLLLFGAQTAMADTVDFYCTQGGAAACNGNVAVSGGNYSTSGINFYLDAGPAGFLGSQFILAFDTVTGSISLTDGSTVLSGVIDSFSANPSGTTTGYNFTATWTSLPVDFSNFLGSSIGADQGFVIYATQTGAATSGDITITPQVPEPSSVLLLGTGLLGIGGFRRLWT